MIQQQKSKKGAYTALFCALLVLGFAILLENLSLEHILRADPDYIFIVQRGDDEAGMRQHVRQLMSENPAWGQLSAVQNARVYFMEKNLYNLKPNHRWGEAYEKLEAIFRDNQE